MFPGEETAPHYQKATRKCVNLTPFTLLHQKSGYGLRREQRENTLYLWWFTQGALKDVAPKCTLNDLFLVFYLVNAIMPLFTLLSKKMSLLCVCEMFVSLSLSAVY